MGRDPVKNRANVKRHTQRSEGKAGRTAEGAGGHGEGVGGVNT